MAARYARYHAPVMDVYDGTVVAYIPIFQEQVCKICTPFLLRPVRMEILIQFVPEYFMGLSRLCSRSPGADDGTQAHLLIYVFRMVAAL